MKILLIKGVSKIQILNSFGELNIKMQAPALLFSLLLQLQLLLHVLYSRDVALHGVQGVELNEADLTVERLLVALLLLL